jgi:predicted ATPase/DNA-binding SARP family transcriptional activator
MKFFVLGPLRATDAGRDVHLGGPRHRTLLAALLVRPRVVVTSDALIDVLWGPNPPKSAAEMLHVRVSELRRLLRSESSEASVVVRQTPGYLVEVAPDDLDSEVFERLATIGRRTFAEGNVAKAASELAAALALWRADPLPEVTDRAYAQSRIAALHDLHLLTIEDAVEVDLLRGRHHEVIGRLMGLTNEHPFRERLWCQLMLAHYRSGRQGDALAEYERIRAQLARELGIDPGTELQDLRLQILRQDPRLGASSRSIPVARHTSENLPNPLTSFVGRVGERDDIDGLLRAARLVTVVGVGGAGKSRLAVEVARAHVDDYPGGVWLIELSPLSDPQLILPTTARVLGVFEHPERGHFEQIVLELGENGSLLVFDNCEHLIDNVARVVLSLLEQCPRLHVICTSRERLQISGESIYRLTGLATPIVDDNVAEVARVEAVHLFRERAKAAQPEFQLSPEVTPLVADICRRLDGLPLAIELAAARIGTFSVAQIAERLDDRFRLLGVGDRSPDDRHRTLRAVVDWSYGLLTDAEKRIFDSLAVFVGGFTFEAAEMVCALIDEDADLSYILDRLVDKSLIQSEATAGPEYRYRLLETLREYGAADLRRRGQVDALRRRHADYFSLLAKNAADGLRGANQPTWLERLTAEHDNLRAALDWNLSAGLAEDAARLAGAIYPFWDLRGHYAEGRRWLERVFGGGGLSPGVRTRALMGLATLTVIQGDLERAAAACDEARALSLRAGDAAGLAHAVQYLGFIAIWAEDLDGATELLTEAISAAREADAPWELGWALLFSATVAFSRGEYERALELTHRSDAALVPVGDLEAAGWNSLIRGGASWAMDDLDESRNALREGIHVFIRLNGVWGMSQGFLLASLLLTSRGCHLEAARLMGACEALRDVAGTGQFPFIETWVAEAMSAIQVAIGPDRMRAAWNAGATSDSRTIIVAVLQSLDQLWIT